MSGGISFAVKLVEIDPPERGRAIVERIRVIASRAFVLVFCIWQVIGHNAHAMEFILDEFTKMEREKVESLLPQLASAYPQAEFFIAGLSSASGEWRFIRVQEVNTCQQDICPTVIMHTTIEWKVLVLISKQIVVSTNYQSGESWNFNFKSKGGADLLLKTSADAKVISILIP